MAKRLVKREVYTTVCWYAVDVTDEQADKLDDLLENDEDAFYDLYSEEFEINMDLVRDKIIDDSTEFTIEEKND
tara:strand:- start:68 stop:289 length:222 start_codon:yes stop_codon:yes gene_type:complete